jgi:hypothetical protein
MVKAKGDRKALGASLLVDAPNASLHKQRHVVGLQCRLHGCTRLRVQRCKGVEQSVTRG